jgi:hypothetical protein
MAELPPIPAALAGRPTVGGLVVPWISIESGDGRHVLGAVHTSRMRRCVGHRLCQVCAEPLTQPAVAFVRQRDLDHGWSAEPALHPVCARYSAAACPMLAGHMDRYRSTPRDLTHLTCNVEGCDCAGWVDSPDQPHRAGQPAEAYYALWLSRYDVATDPAGQVLGVAWRREYVRRIRPVVEGSPEPVLRDFPAAVSGG